jgi:hypothetical protein
LNHHSHGSPAHSVISLRGPTGIRRSRSSLSVQPMARRLLLLLHASAPGPGPGPGLPPAIPGSPRFLPFWFASVSRQCAKPISVAFVLMLVASLQRDVGLAPLPLPRPRPRPRFGSFRSGNPSIPRCPPAGAVKSGKRDEAVAYCWSW